MNAALNKLYFEDEPTELANGDPDFTFDESIFDDAATEILQNGGYTPEMLTKGACNSLVRETFKVLGGGALHGLDKEPDPEMASALRENAFVFSGFKIHNELGEVTNAFKYMPELTDDKGNIRPFHEISKEVDRILADHKIRGINARYNQTYLRAEYNQAVQSAQMAAKYHDALSRKDYINLQYRTANDERVRTEHQKLHGVTLPVDDPFWNDYTPPLGWNCRCTIAEVLKDDYPVSDSTRATSTAERITSAPKDKIFRFNPAKEKRVFPRQHPYLPKGCGGCNKGIGSKNLAYNIKNPICQACIAIEECKARELGQPDTKKWISNIAKQVSNGKICKTAITISKPQTELIEYAERNGIELGKPILRISDEKILHALRDAKTDRGAALTQKELSEIATILPQCNIYYDPTHENFVYVYKKYGRTIKYVFQPNYKAKMDGEKESAIHFLTGGKIEVRNIPDNWIQIKNSN